MEKESLRMTAKQEAEKIELLAEVKNLNSIFFLLNYNGPIFSAGESSVRATGGECGGADAEEQQ